MFHGLRKKLPSPRNRDNSTNRLPTQSEESQSLKTKSISLRNLFKRSKPKKDQLLPSRSVRNTRKAYVIKTQDHCVRDEQLDIYADVVAQDTMLQICGHNTKIDIDSDFKGDTTTSGCSRVSVSSLSELSQGNSFHFKETFERELTNQQYVEVAH